MTRDQAPTVQVAWVLHAPPDNATFEVHSTARGVVCAGWFERPSMLAEGDPHGSVDAFERYFRGELDALQRLPLCPEGTPFQRRVWAALPGIPAAETTSYARLADALGSVPRAVGGAVGRNPIAIAIPCHRVIGSGGDLTGYAGGIERKRWLLRHEGVVLPGDPRRLF